MSPCLWHVIISAYFGEVGLGEGVFIAEALLSSQDPVLADVVRGIIIAKAWKVRDNGKIRDTARRREQDANRGASRCSGRTQRMSTRGNRCHGSHTTHIPADGQVHRAQTPETALRSKLEAKQHRCTQIPSRRQDQAANVDAICGYFCPAANRKRPRSA